MKIAITIPMRDGMIHTATGWSLSGIPQVAKPEGWTVKRFDVLGNTVIPLARASLVAQALGWGADKIVFIDDDVSFTPEQFRTLIKAPRTVVTGDYAMRPFVQGATDLTSTAQMFGDNPTHFNADGLAPVTKFGFGFLRVDRRVFADLAPKRPLLCPREGHSDVDALFYREWFPYSRTSLGPHPVTREEYFDWHSADVAFAQACTAIGHPCFLHKDLTCGHHYGPIEYRPTQVNDEKS